MAHEIDLRTLQQTVNTILEHVINDLGVEKLALRENSDFYWEVPSDKLYEVRENQPQLDVGRLTDDWEFLAKMLEDKNGAVALMLIHVAPMLRFVGEEIGQ